MRRTCLILSYRLQIDGAGPACLRFLLWPSVFDIFISDLLLVLVKLGQIGHCL